MRNRIYESLPDEGKKKVEAFQSAFKIYFKNQKDAIDIFKASQESISRYLNGEILLPLEIARRFEDYTDGAVKADSIFFDYRAYKFEKKRRKSVNKTTMLA
ncbi:transcriptional regulator [Acinetobacter indicus]|uniref:transcriptional regulator n=1 Tax=Acinetobacter indicus TaxID=756892 RepID=UPI00209B4FAE|nr:transcriptional regulator [Acinetobacter indicus]MCO8088225.1 transcriptional regulator [Acinetobacter indicus]